MENGIIWYHNDCAQPSVMRATPHPEDWNVGHWSFDRISRFIAARDREVRKIAASLRQDNLWFGHGIHCDPVHPANVIAVHTSVMDRGKCAVALVSAKDTAGGSEVVAVVSPDRLRKYSPRHITRQVKFIAPSWRDRIYRKIWTHRFEGSALAFSVPITATQCHAPGTVLHDYERALIRAIAVCLSEEDARYAEARGRMRPHRGARGLGEPAQPESSVPDALRRHGASGVIAARCFR
jgi:hypothetical protein